MPRVGKKKLLGFCFVYNVMLLTMQKAHTAFALGAHFLF